MGDNGIRSKLGVRRDDPAYRRVWRSQRRADGLCVECGQPRENQRYKCCMSCRQKMTSRTTYIMQHRMHRTTGLPLDVIKKLWTGRHDSCEICGMPGLESSTGVLSFDHNHATGEFRGWLCQPCNFAVGHLESFRDALPKMLAYLDKATPSAIDWKESNTDKDVTIED